MRYAADVRAGLNWRRAHTSEDLFSSWKVFIMLHITHMKCDRLTCGNHERNRARENRSNPANVLTSAQLRDEGVNVGFLES